MTTDVPEAPAPRFSRKQLVAAAIIAGALVLTGGGTAAAVAYTNAAAAQAAAEDRAAEEARSAAAAESAALSLYLKAIEASRAEAGIITADAGALTVSASPLLSAEDLASLATISEAIATATDFELPADADSAAARKAFAALDAAVGLARADYAPIVERVGAAAQAAHDGYTLADAASLAAIVSAKAAFTGAAANKLPSAEAFTALTAAVTTAGASHQAAAELAAAAAEAAKSGKKTYTHNGQTYYSGTTTPAVPGTTAPPSPGSPGTPSEPIKSASTKASELAAKYGGSTSVAGACVALNYGHVTGTSSFGPSSTYDGYYSAVSVTSEANPNYVNYYAVQWYACPN